MGIRKTILLLLLSVFVPLLFLQAFTFYSWYRERKQTEMRSNAEIARTVAKSFETFVFDVIRTEAAIGKAATVKPPPSQNALRQILLSAQMENKAFREFLWAGPDGRVLAASRPEAESLDLSKTGHFADYIYAEDWVLTNLFTSELTGRQIFAIVRPVRDASGKLLGIVSAAIVPGMMDNVLAIEREEDGGISLVDAKGMHVYRYPSTQYSDGAAGLAEALPVMAQTMKGKEVTAKVRAPRRNRGGSPPSRPSAPWGGWSRQAGRKPQS